MKAHSGGSVLRREGGATELCSHGNPVHMGSRVLIQGGSEEKQEWSFWRLVLLPAPAGLGWSDSAVAARGRVRNTHVWEKIEGLSGTRPVSELVWSRTTAWVWNICPPTPACERSPAELREANQARLKEPEPPAQGCKHITIPSPRLTAPVANWSSNVCGYSVETETSKNQRFAELKNRLLC